MNTEDGYSETVAQYTQALVLSVRDNVLLLLLFSLEQYNKNGENWAESLSLTLLHS